MDINKKIIQQLVKSETIQTDQERVTEDVVLYSEFGELKQYKIIIPQDDEEDSKKIYFWAKSDEDAFTIATMNKLPSLLIRVVKDKNNSRVCGLGIYENKEYEEDSFVGEVAMPEETDWEKYNEEQRKLYPNHGKAWTKEEESLLILLYVEKKCSIDTLTSVFNRNRNAIVRKLINLDIINK